MSFGSNKVQYKKKKKSLKKKYGKEVIDEVIFGDERFATEHYKYVPIRKRKFVMMELVVSGKVDLYRIKSSYYLLRDNEEVSKLIVNSFDLFYVSRAKEYFSDCKKIVYYLENEIYQFDNIIDLVEDYNLLCE